MIKSTTQQFKFRVLTISLATLWVFALSGCAFIPSGGSSSADDGPDITVPPVLLGDERVEQVETSPDEVISYDEWQKRRVNAAKKAKELEEKQQQEPEQAETEE